MQRPLNFVRIRARVSPFDATTPRSDKIYPWRGGTSLHEVAMLLRSETSLLRVLYREPEREVQRHRGPRQVGLGNDIHN